MSPEPKSRPGLPSHAEARAIVDRARRLRAEALAQLARAAWSRLARRPAGIGQGALPHARA
jgi:hypothetical protein